MAAAKVQQKAQPKVKLGDREIKGKRKGNRKKTAQGKSRNTKFKSKNAQRSNK